MNAEVIFHARCDTLGEIIEFCDKLKKLDLDPDTAVVIRTDYSMLSVSTYMEFEPCECGECGTKTMLQTCSCEV